MDVFVLSPHLDDGVISAGGMIARAVSEGKKVQVVTFATKEPELEKLPKKFRRFADYKKRKEEDRQALGSLGASRQWLDFSERIFTKPPLHSLQAVFHTPKGSGTDDFVDLLAKKMQIEALAKDNPHAEIMSPLGIGNHFDHVELFLASIMAMTESGLFDRFSFYEDGYAVMTRARKKHFLAKTEGYDV